MLMGHRFNNDLNKIDQRNSYITYIVVLYFQLILHNFVSAIELRIFNKTKKMLPFDIQIEKLQKEEYEKAATLLTDAFESNAAYALIFKDSEKLRDGLFWLFKTNLFLINRRMSVTKVVKKKKSDEIIGIFSLLPPGGVKSKLRAYLQVGLPQFILKFGFRTLYRMLEMDSHNKELLNKAIRITDYYYLSMVVVSEECRGTGIGSFMITSCLEELRATKKQCHTLGLTTQLPENVTFYTRLGFQKLDEGEVQFKQDRYYNYNMKLDL